MDKINEFSAGIEAGKGFLLCCALTGAAQEEPRSQTRRFDATLQDLVYLREPAGFEAYHAPSAAEYWVN